MSDSVFQGLDYLGRLAMWNGKKKFALENMRRICDALGNPQDHLRCVHITGTNGKGSVSASIASILGASGLKTALYTSPHLSQINERFIVDGLPVCDEVLNASADRVRIMANKMGLDLTFFEAVTATAFLTFIEEKVDYAVIEVGLGGEQDATNVISKPEIAIIVSIGLDHQNILGETEAEIARDKAGISKYGAGLVVGPVSQEAREAIEQRAKVSGVIPQFFGEDFYLSGDGRAYRDLDLNCIDFWTQLRGDHQLKNAAVSIRAALQLGVSHEYIKTGLERVFWPARLEEGLINDSTRLLIDCAHNIDGVRSLANFLRDSKRSNMGCILGFLESAPWQEMIELLRPYITRWGICQPETARAVPIEIVSKHLSSIGISSRILEPDTVPDFCLEQVDLEYLISGSIYLVGPLRAKLGIPYHPIWQRSIPQSGFLQEQSYGS